MAPKNTAPSFTFPIGYHEFHKDQLFNFQLNRWHSLGYLPFDALREAGLKVSTFDDWKVKMLSLAEEAVSEERLMNAAFYYRAAEFYVLTDHSEREVLYDRFIDLFYLAFQDAGIERLKVPYRGAFLPALRVPPVCSGTDEHEKGDGAGYRGEKKGTIVMHGGFDSFIEEFYSWMSYFSARGYEVIAFEGPGQGAALRKYGLTLDYQWERPTKAVLDHFRLDNVTLLGISMGGWFCFRAAAFEPRIKRVIASGIAYDYMKTMNFVLREIHMLFIRHFRDLSNRTILKGLKKGVKKGRGMQAWQAAQLMYVTGEEVPMDAFEVMFRMNEGNLHSDMVKQDVLILTGRDDHFIPFRAHDMQVNALTNARSVTARVFTKEEHAQNHCQIGNVGLALEVMVDWLDCKTGL